MLLPSFNCTNQRNKIKILLRWKNGGVSDENEPVRVYGNTANWWLSIHFFVALGMFYGYVIIRIDLGAYSGTINGCFRRFMETMPSQMNILGIRQFFI